MFFTRSCSGLGTPNLVVSTVPPSTPMQFGVYSTPRVLCPDWQILECSTSHYGVCITLDVGVLTAHYSPDCASDTTADTACAHQVFTLCNALKRHTQIHAMIQATND